MPTQTQGKTGVVKPGDTLVFRGVCWDDGWEFMAPCIVYEPIPRFGECGSLSADSIIAKVEDLCIDICCDDGKYNPEWHPSELREFEWRGWSIARLRRRKKAIHATVIATFRLDDEGELAFDLSTD